MLATSNKIIIGITVFLILVIIACLTYVGLFFRAIGAMGEMGKPTYEKIEISCVHNNEKIYLKKKAWGLLGDSQMRIISTNPKLKFEHDYNTDYVYWTDSPISYFFENDTLYIYTGKISKVPPLFKSKIKVIQVEVRNCLQMDSIIQEKYANKTLNEF